MTATYGMSAANLANKWLNILATGTAFPSPPADLYWALHISAPGAAGTEGGSAGTTARSAAVAHTTPSGGSMSQSGAQPTWTNTLATGSPPGQETLAGISSWDNATPGSGDFLYSFALSASQVWQDTNTFTMTTWSWGLTPIASG
jgi:hypothetical protein